VGAEFRGLISKRLLRPLAFRDVTHNTDNAFGFCFSIFPKSAYVENPPHYAVGAADAALSAYIGPRRNRLVENLLH